MGEYMILEGVKKDLGAFLVRRFLPAPGRRMVGPWIFFDHFGPALLGEKEALDVRSHPHINLATVTYLFEGEIIHRDSLGSVQNITPGELNLMVAGRGIVHSERESSSVRQKSRTLHGLQLWFALPATQEECEPTFFHYSEEELPVADINGVKVKVMIGSAYGMTSPVETYSETFYATAYLKKGRNLIVSDMPDIAIYTVSGHLHYDQEPVAKHTMMVLPSSKRGKIEAIEDSLIVMIGGAPLGQRHIEWNFVSSSKDRIEKAKDRWRMGSFPSVPGDEEEYIPLPER